ncbi:hypothetical protein NDU88_010869 [Pleurodeles waltl]|uniref:Uncharacterized protein n=1 Tax=Pleurodeles waltl TaxID=8319 RepID=A0AAV7Q3F9_PLEWA|nr:hypothetical protein NDU88_010869 [Pleurodeles waltl]
MQNRIPRGEVALAAKKPPCCPNVREKEVAHSWFCFLPLPSIPRRMYSLVHTHPAHGAQTHERLDSSAPNEREPRRPLVGPGVPRDPRPKSRKKSDPGRCLGEGRARRRERSGVAANRGGPRDGEPSSGRSLRLLELGAVLRTPRTGAPSKGPEERGRALPAAGESRQRVGLGEDHWARGWAPRLGWAPGLGLGPQTIEDPGLPYPGRLGSGPAAGAARALSCPRDQTLKRARSSGGGTRRSEADPRGPSEREVRDGRNEPPIL